MTEQSRRRNEDLVLDTQQYGDNPLEDRETGLYRGEYVKTFVEKWDELINWDARASSEGAFFIDMLRARGKHTVLDVATGTGFHSVRLQEAGFEVTSADGSAAMLAKAFANAQARGLILKTIQADWRWLNRSIHGKYDAIICLGNSFTHLHTEADRRRALAEFYAALKHDGILILDQRNYDAMLDDGFKTKHKFYYVGEQVTAEPEYLDEGLVRFRYSFPDGSEYNLNMCPIRKGYVRRLIAEAGFQRVRTYGDFQETYAESDPDFFIHVAEKSPLHFVHPGEQQAAKPDIRTITEDYYDSNNADAFYSIVWGGEDVHIGMYDDTSDIRTASHATVELMASRLPQLAAGALVLDLGAGYGGAMRHLVSSHNVNAVCLNISETQNDANRHKNGQAGLSDRIRVVHGVFENVPEPADSFDVVWSQDAFLHSDDRAGVLAEAFRVLKPGGCLIFTDPMQADDVPEGVLQPVYDRLSLNSLGSMGFYREAAQKIGFEVLAQEDHTKQLRRHYERVREELLANRAKLLDNGADEAYLDKMAAGLQNWVTAADAGHLAWGVQLFRKPARA